MKCGCGEIMLDVDTWEDANATEYHQSVSLFQCPKCKAVKTVRL